MPRIYNLTAFLSLIGFLFSLAGALTKGGRPEIFAWLFFYMPFLWIIWICCLFFLGAKNNIIKLAVLWLFIDISTLLLFISFALGVNDWAHAKGIELVVFTAYSPVIIPLGFLFNFASEAAKQTVSKDFEIFVKFFGGGAGDAFAIWLCMSGVAAIQSLGLVGLSLFLGWGKRKFLDVK